MSQHDYAVKPVGNLSKVSAPSNFRLGVLSLDVQQIRISVSSPRSPKSDGSVSKRWTLQPWSLTLMTSQDGSNTMIPGCWHHLSASLKTSPARDRWPPYVANNNYYSYGWLETGEGDFQQIGQLQYCRVEVSNPRPRYDVQYWMNHIEPQSYCLPILMPCAKIQWKFSFQWFLEPLIGKVLNHPKIRCP